MTIQAIEKIAYAAFEHFNRKMKTNYTSDNVKLAFYDNSDADEQYRRFCKEFFPDKLTDNNELRNALASAFTGKDFDGIMIRRDFSVVRVNSLQSFFTNYRISGVLITRYPRAIFTIDIVMAMRRTLCLTGLSMRDMPFGENLRLSTSQRTFKA